MAFLTSSSTGRTRVLALLLFLGVGGCVLIDAFAPGPKPLAFSHRIHVTGEGLDCVDCHRGAQSQDDPGMPVLKQCLLCHEELDAKKPEARRVTTLFDGKDFKAAHASRLGGEVRFSHQQHVAKGEECASCHAGIEENEVIDHRVAVTMDGCMACHATKGTSNECATCHREVRADAAPRTHAHHWLRIHGKVVRAEGTATVDRCTLCHESSSCASCHLEVPPANHDHYFRRRGHGVVARMNRETCSACHRADSCDSCHRETRPQNHVGSWGSTRNTHCGTCHFPLRADECAVCHKSTPSHSLAAPMPSWHAPGMNCRQCHGLTAPLPHVDKGDVCTACHR